MAAPRDEPTLRALECQGLVVVRTGSSEQRWYLTQLGCDSVAQTVCSVTDAELFFRVRDEVAIEDRTCYELVRMLSSDDWVWDVWVPPSNRRRRSTASIPYGYCAGEEKKFYLSMNPCRQYLVALACSKDHIKPFRFRV